MKSPSAEQWYQRAYNLHYKEEDYREAYASYLLVSKCFSKTREAKYAIQQMDNIRRSKYFCSDFDSYAELVTEDYYDIDQMMFDVITKVHEGIQRFPQDEMVECSLAILSKDENNFYYCGYGKLEQQLNLLSNALDVESTITIITELVDNIVKNDSIYVIPLDNIVYFQEKGEITYSTNISGGGGGSKSMSIGGAIAGKLMFGDVGAIIGSRAGTGVHINEIKSEAVEHDNRYVVLRYIDDNRKYCDLQMAYECYEVLNRMMPDKEYSYVSLNGISTKEDTPQKPQLENSSAIPVEQLRQLKSLLDDGIITQEDFEAKKKQLLGI